jgi:hypothetical protein
MARLQGIFLFCAFALWFYVTVHLWKMVRPKPGLPLYHVKVSLGGIVYQDYFTTNPPVKHQQKEWFYCLTNFN